MENSARIKCPKCGSENVKIQIVTETKTKRRGCIGWFFWILLVLCTFGLLIIIPLLTNSKVQSDTHKVAICQNCGRSWRIT
jgi:predicted nucleic-acid-binding Zn-ribbon protein